jgi:hypothetical protein
VCGGPVVVVRAAPSRQQVSAVSAVYRSLAWCRLWPCGHTFTVRGAGLIQ